MDREDFLARLRVPHQSVPEGTRYRPPPAPSRREMMERLTRELEAVSGVVHRAGSPEEVGAAVLRILTERRIRRVIRGATPLIEKLELDAGLERAGIEVTVAGPREASRQGTSEELRDAAFAADAGITSVDVGVAETGTLVILAAPGQGRSISLLPPLHVAVLESRDLVYELAALFARVTQGGGELPSALTMITGPSRTGDIELVFTVGVHGPGELHLVLLD